MMNNTKKHKQQQKKIINVDANENDKIHRYVANVIKKSKKNLEKLETEITTLEQINN